MRCAYRVKYEMIRRFQSLCKFEETVRKMPVCVAARKTCPFPCFFLLFFFTISKIEKIALYDMCTGLRIIDGPHRARIPLLKLRVEITRLYGAVVRRLHFRHRQGSTLFNEF